MRRRLADSQESFDALLTWLDPDREAAGRKYAVIHGGLVKIFVSRGFSDAEGLADLTIKRVIELLPRVRDSYVGERALYFYKVAGYIALEARRRPEIAADVSPVEPAHEDNTNDRYERLLTCLQLLPEEKRRLVLDYHLHKGRDKIEQHERMAKERGISVEALRSRAHHIRKALKDCVQQRERASQKERKAVPKPLLHRW
jgi:DNA-directed RNA polymerase specialized sigma24 family protein